MKNTEGVNNTTDKEVRESLSTSEAIKSEFKKIMAQTEMLQKPIKIKLVLMVLAIPGSLFFTLYSAMILDKAVVTPPDTNVIINIYNGKTS